MRAPTTIGVAFGDFEVGCTPIRSIGVAFGDFEVGCTPIRSVLCLGLRAGNPFGTGGGDDGGGDGGGDAGIKDRGNDVILGEIAVGD
jgi:hypothetical protein